MMEQHSFCLFQIENSHGEPLSTEGTIPNGDTTGHLSGANYQSVSRLPRDTGYLPTSRNGNNLKNHVQPARTAPYHIPQRNSIQEMTGHLSGANYLSVSRLPRGTGYLPATSNGNNNLQQAQISPYHTQSNMPGRQVNIVTCQVHHVLAKTG